MSQRTDGTPESPLATPEGEGPLLGDAAPPHVGGHPAGLWVLFITEMWERFSYYGMRALLVLFLTASTAEMVVEDGTEVINKFPGFGWGDADAYTLYGTYTFMVYVTSIFGGLIADKVFGTHKSLIVGGWMIALGHIALAVSELFGFQAGAAVGMDSAAGRMLVFLAGLSLIIIGTGFFKPCVSVMVGQLYGKDDPRRDSGFTIYYMGINLGAFLAPIVGGWLAQKYGWHFGFGAAAVGMILAMFCYITLRARYMRDIGLAPLGEVGPRDKKLVLAAWIGLVGVPVLPLVLYATGGLGAVTHVWSQVHEALGMWGMAAVLTALLVGAAMTFIMMQPREERPRIGVIFTLAILGNIFFWTAFEQAGSSMTIFADRNTDLTLWGLMGKTASGASAEFPAAWYQSVNPLAILIFGGVFSWLWVWLDRRGKDPSTPMKFAIGLWLLGLAFIAMIFGAMDAKNGGNAGAHWLLITYIVYTWGELCLSPVGLSMVTKLAPMRLQSLMMGLWWFTLALSNLTAGLVAVFSTKFVPDPETGAAATSKFVLDGLPGFFLMLVVFPIGAGVVILMLTPMLKKMMGGVK